MLLLPVKSLFPPPFAEQIAVRPALRDDPVVLGNHADLLPKLALQRLPQRLSLVHAALRKLPRAFDLEPLTNENWQGSADSRSRVKKIFMGIVIGLILLVGAYYIVEFVLDTLGVSGVYRENSMLKRN